MYRRSGEFGTIGRLGTTFGRVKQSL